MEFVGHTLVLIAIKLAVLFPLALTFGYALGDSVRITFLLAQAGEFGFVLFGSALVLEVITQATFVMAIGVISLSMLATPLLVRVGNALAVRLEGKEVKPGGALSGKPLGAAEERVLIGGYGRMGHTVATLLDASGVPFIAFDTDPERVAQGQACGHSVLYGEISDPELLETADAETASLVVITIDHAASALQAVSILRNTYPSLPIIARARDLEASSRLKEAGATEAFPEAVEASLRLGGAALQMVGAPAEDVELLLNGVRSRNYELVTERGAMKSRGEG
jgi:glutathione-regulated potassium-efflux system protein KefB